MFSVSLLLAGSSFPCGLMVINISYYNNLEKNRGHPPRDGQELQGTKYNRNLREQETTETERGCPTEWPRRRSLFCIVLVLVLVLIATVCYFPAGRSTTRVQRTTNLRGQRLRKLRRLRRRERVPN